MAQPSFRSQAASESLRVGLLLAAAFWLAWPLFTNAAIGGGDAVWYHHQIADAVTQFRSGVFPVFVGQTEYSFNGAVHPIRTAPLCQYLAGLIDWLTGRTLGFNLLLHLTAALSLVGGALSAYGAFCWLAPARRWRAAALAWIYVACPGVAGLAYAQDLYMSMTAIPWVPWVAVALLRQYADRGFLSPAVLGASLGALWWAHSPIAFWLTLAVFGLEALRWVTQLAGGESVVCLTKRALVEAAAFGVLAGYPLVSVLSLRFPGEAIVPHPLDRGELLRQIAGAFPGNLAPLDLRRPLLEMMQPGYAVLAAWVAAAGAWASAGRTGRRSGGWLLLAVALGFFALMLPIPGATVWIWRRLPETLVGVTNLWPMQRFCILIAGTTLAAAMALWRESGRFRVGVVGCLAMAVVWSAYEGDQLRQLARRQTMNAAESAKLEQLENVNVSAYCYQQLPQRPAYFIHGVTDPEMEQRLLIPERHEVVSNRAAIENASLEPWQPLRREGRPGAAAQVLSPRLVLKPGIRYLLTFRFGPAELSGVLRITGKTMSRVYVLPSAGDAKGFGPGAGQEKSLSLWTTENDGPEEVTLEYLPADTVAAAALGETLAEVKLTEIDPRRLPVELNGLVPLRATVHTEEPVVLETMRMAIPGWSARMAGAPADVGRSAEGLVTVSVPAGVTRVEVIYAGSPRLSVAFWLGVLGWLGLAALLGVAVFRAFGLTPVSRTENEA